MISCGRLRYCGITKQYTSYRISLQASSSSLRPGKSGADVGSRPARGDAHDQVPGSDPLVVHRRGAGIHVVLRALFAAHQRGIPSRDDADHHVGRRAEGRRALRRIQPSHSRDVALPELTALRIRVEDITRHWLQGSDRQTPSHSGP